MRKISEQVLPLLKPFEKALGDSFPRVVRDMSSFLGSQAFTTDEGDLKAGSKLSVVSKDMHKMSLPPNNPLSHLFHFSLRIREIAKAGEMELQATLPKEYKAAFEQMKLRAEVSTPATPASK